jgi:flotillin
MALRAEAYKQYNQAAVMTTMLENLPAIVRAAAEPMANIGQLTVLSTDGASDVVRTTTETVAQANATIKGLTGVDLASVVSKALGPDASKAGGPTRLRQRLFEDGAAPSGGASESRAARRARAVGPAPDAKGATSAQPPAQGSGTSPAATAAPTASAPAPSVTPAPMAPEAPAAAPAVPPSPPTLVITPPAAAAPAPAAAGSVKAVDLALREIAGHLRVIPGINTPPVRAITLEEIGSRGPASARALWARYEGRIPPVYRELTIGQLLDRYNG